MKQNSNKLNYLYNTFNQILSILAPLITTPYVSRVLCADGIGQYSYTYSIVSYFVLIATLGSTAFGQREIAYSCDDKRNRSRIFWNILTLRIITSAVALLLYLFFVSFIYAGGSKILLYIQSIYIINVALDTTWYFQGMAQFITITLRNTCIRLLSIFMIFLLIKNESDTLIYASLLALSATLSFLITLPLLDEEIEKVRKEDIKFKGIVSKCFVFFIPTIAVQLYTVLDKTMIGVFSINNVENGYYEQSEKIVKMTIVLITSLSTVLAPRIAASYKIGDIKQITIYMKQLIQYVFIMGLPIVVGLICISDYFIPIFLGDGFDKCIILMKIFAPIVIFIGFSNALGTTFLVQTGNQKIVNYSVFFGAIVNIILNMFLIPKFISAGAAVASVCSEFAVFMFQLIATKSFINIRDIFRGNIISIIVAVTMGVFIWVIGAIMRYYDITFSLIVFAQIVIGAIYYFSMLLVFKEELVCNLKILRK